MKSKRSTLLVFALVFIFGLSLLSMHLWHKASNQIYELVYVDADGNKYQISGPNESVLTKIDEITYALGAKGQRLELTDVDEDADVKIKIGEKELPGSKSENPFDEIDLEKTEVVLAYDVDGSNLYSKTHKIEVIPYITSNKSTIELGKSVHLTDSTKGARSWNWLVKNRSISSDKEFDWTPKNSGKNEVVAEITLDNGQILKTTKTIIVKKKPEEPKRQLAFNKKKKEATTTQTTLPAEPPRKKEKEEEETSKDEIGDTFESSLAYTDNVKSNFSKNTSPYWWNEKCRGSADASESYIEINNLQEDLCISTMEFMTGSKGNQKMSISVASKNGTYSDYDSYTVIHRFDEAYKVDVSGLLCGLKKGHSYRITFTPAKGSQFNSQRLGSEKCKADFSNVRADVSTSDYCKLLGMMVLYDSESAQ